MYCITKTLLHICEKEQELMPTHPFSTLMIHSFMCLTHKLYGWSYNWFKTTDQLHLSTAVCLQLHGTCFIWRISLCFNLII